MTLGYVARCSGFRHDRAVRRLSLAHLLSLSLLILLAGLVQAPAASAIGCTPISDFPAPPPNAPLPGSCFEGNDGNQVDPDDVTPDPPAAPNRLDWGSTSVSSTAQRTLDYTQGAADSQFTGGTEEAPDTWQWGVGSLASDNHNTISGYSFQEPGTQDLILALGFVRESNNGTSWLAFELNQQLPGYRSEPLVGAVPAQDLAVPTRSPGDLLITYSVSNNNSPKPIIGLCKWLGDENVGVWTNMAGVPVASNCPPLSASVAQADLNNADIPTGENFLGSPAGLLQAGTFGEAVLNLTEAVKAAGGNPNTDDPCLDFAYFWAHSRSSEPITSAQQDLILPADAISAANCAVEGTKWNDKDGNGLLDAGDEGVGGWTIYADYDNDGVHDPSERSDVTAPKDANDLRPTGTYSLTELAEGTYPIREVPQAGWECTAPGAYDTDPAATDPDAPELCASEVDMTGAVIDGVDFLNFQAPVDLPPTTTIALDPFDPSGNNGWYRGDVEVTVSASDDGSGVAETRCSLDPSAAPAAFADLDPGCAYAGPGADVTADGDHTVYAASEDLAGNAETPINDTFKIDATAPTVTCPSPIPTFVAGSSGVVTAAVTDPTSGPLSATVSSAASTAATGVQSITLAGEDQAGNSTTRSCSYLVAYTFLGYLSPPSGSRWARGQTVPVSFALTSAAGVRISDATAAALLRPTCRVKFSVSGAATQSAACVKYDAVTNQFGVKWKIPRRGHGLTGIFASLLNGLMGKAVLKVEVTYGSATTTHTENIRITG